MSRIFIMMLLKIDISVCFPIEHEVRRENIFGFLPNAARQQVFERYSRVGSISIEVETEKPSVLKARSFKFMCNYESMA